VPKSAERRRRPLLYRTKARLKRSRRFRMRGSASYSYPTHSKQMNHAPKWPTEFRRHVASAHANRSAYTRARARASHARPLPVTSRGPGWNLGPREARTRRRIYRACQGISHETNGHRRGSKQTSTLVQEEGRSMFFSASSVYSFAHGANNFFFLLDLLI